MTLKIMTFGHILTSRPAGREAALVCVAYNPEFKTSTEADLDFEGVLVMTPSWLSEFIQTLKEKGISKINFLPSKNPSVTASIEFIQSEIE